MMKKLFSTMLVFVIMASTAFADEWKIDKTHSSVSFKVRHMAISRVKGGFDEFSGIVQFDGKNVNRGSVELSIDVASVNTKDKKRDTDLKSPVFFDVVTYPLITFKSTSITEEGDGFKINGDMTMKDVTKEVSFDVEFSGIIVDPWGKTRAGFEAFTTINRQDFNLNFSKTLDNGGLIVGNEVEIELEFEIVKVEPEIE